MRAAVDELLVAPGDGEARVIGVRVKGEELRAPVVISAAGAYTTLIRMVPERDAMRAQARSADFAELRGLLLRGDDRPPGTVREEGGDGQEEDDALPLSRTWASLFVAHVTVTPCGEETRS